MSTCLRSLTRFTPGLAVLVACATASARPEASDATVPLRRGTYEVTDRIDVANDCPERKIRGKKVRICDLAPAFDRVFAACEPEVDRGPFPGGCVITIAPGTYELKKTLEICRPHVIRGAGGGAFNPATHIYTPDGVTAFRYLPFAKCRLGPVPGAAGGELSHLALEAHAHTSTTPFYGLEIAAKVIIQQVWVRGYVQGIRINAGARRKEQASNANGWWLADVWIDQSAHAGLHIDGPDTNAGLALMPVATSNCQEAMRFEKILGPCANIFSGDFLGSTIVAGVTATAKETKTDRAFPGYVMGDSANSRAVCVGCYAEGDQLPSVLAKNANAFGGLAVWKGAGWFIGPSIGGLRLLNDRDPQNRVELTMGNLAADGTFLELSPSVDEALRLPLRIKLDRKNASFRFDVGNLNDAAPLSIGASQAAPGGLGALRLTPIKAKEGVSVPAK